MTVASVATKDEGTYVCAAQNKYGKSEVSTKIVSVISKFLLTLCLEYFPDEVSTKDICDEI